MPKINSLEVVHQDTNKDSYDNLHDILVALKDAVGLTKEGNEYSVNKEVIDGQARAAYETLLEMYVNDKEAFARRLETLTAEFGTSIAKVLEEWAVYASATEAYAKKIEEVSAKAFQNEAKVTEEMYARVTADEAVAKLVTTLRADFESAQTRSRASIKEEQIARANADEALASRSFVMEAAIEDANARITQEQLVRAAADEAIALNIESLTASVEDNSASILLEQTARANADSALATQINTVSATAGSKNRTYVQTTEPTGSTLVPLVSGDLWFDSDFNYKLYRYNGSSWVAVDDSRIAANTAAISNEQIARVNSDSALAIDIDSVVARLDTGDFATVKTQAEAGATKNRSFRQTSQPTGTTANPLVIGDLWFDTDADNKTYRWNGSSWEETTDTRIANTYARWGVQVDANGNVAGIQLNANSSGTSEFTVVANNFKVYGSGGQESTQKPLDVSVSGSTQTTYLGNALITYYEGTSLNRWAAINNIKASGVYARPTATSLVDLPYSWASNGSAGFFAGNAGTGGNYHGLRGAAFTNNSDASITSRGIVGSHTGAAFFAEVGGYAPFTGEHQSVVNKGYEIQEGQIVVDKEIVMKKDISNTLSRVEKSNTVNQKGVIGVFTRNNGHMSKIDTLAVITEHRVDDGFGNLTGPLTEQYDQIKDLYDVVSINALGEGQILVCGENGNISTGDLIVTSSVEGVGMKQSDDVIKSYTVAKAREDITFEDTTTSKLVSCIYLCG